MFIYFFEIIQLLAGLTVPDISTAGKKEQKRVYNGRNTTIEEFPHLVQFAWKGQTENSSKCCGSIIGKNLVLTAAHCIQPKYKGRYIVRSGTSYQDGRKAKIHDVVEAIVHEKYESYDLGHDLAIVKVRPSFSFGATRKPIPISTTPPKTGDIGVITGWGCTDKNSTMLTDVLQTATVPVYEIKDCNVKFPLGDGELPVDNFCAGGESYTRKGDSGSPLTINGKIAGIDSWGLNIHDDLYPDAVLSVPYHAAWIKKTVAKLNETDVVFA